MTGLKMPGKGNSATMLQDLNEEHAQLSTPLLETNVTTLQDYKTEDNEIENLEQQNTNKKKARSKPSSANSTDNKPNDDSKIFNVNRLTSALLRVEDDEVIVVTVRVSAKLNRYMDEYVSRINKVNPKKKYRKQDAIAYAFASFYATHLLPDLPDDEDL